MQIDRFPLRVFSFFPDVLTMLEFFARPTSSAAATLLVCCMAVLSGAALAQTATKPDLAAGANYYNANCMSCHGQAGNSVIDSNPKLAGQFAPYLLTSLQAFKQNKRGAGSPMPGFVAAMSEQDKVNVSAWLSQQKPVPGNSRNSATLRQGERIYRGGIRDRAIAACAACHGPAGQGIPTQYPAIAGQHASYIEAQLKAFRDGQRTNHPVMPGVVAKLLDAEMKAVADYIAGLRSVR